MGMFWIKKGNMVVRDLRQQNRSACGGRRLSKRELERDNSWVDTLAHDENHKEEH